MTGDRPIGLQKLVIGLGHGLVMGSWSPMTNRDQLPTLHSFDLRIRLVTKLVMPGHDLVMVIARPVGVRVTNSSSNYSADRHAAPPTQTSWDKRVSSPSTSRLEARHG